MFYSQQFFRNAVQCDSIKECTRIPRVRGYHEGEIGLQVSGLHAGRNTVPTSRVCLGTRHEAKMRYYRYLKMFDRNTIILADDFVPNPILLTCCVYFLGA